MFELIYTGCCSLKFQIESTAANRITACRLAMLPFYAFFHFAGNYELAFKLSLAIIIGDALDGYVARSLGEESEFGAKFDPVADKISIAVLFFIIILGLRSVVAANFLLAIVAKVFFLFIIEFMLLAIGIYSVIKKIKGGANIFGKCKMAVECVTYVGSYYLLFISPGAFSPEQIAVMANLLLICSICLAAMSLMLHITDFLKVRSAAV